MIRISIRIPHELKVWLDAYSKRNNKSNTKTIIEAIKAYRKKIETESKANLLSQTSGLWIEKNKDGLEYVESLRNEW